jgi:hypothetical protein
MRNIETPDDTVTGCYCRCEDLYEDFIIFGSRFFHLCELKNLRWSAFRAGNRFYDFLQIHLGEGCHLPLCPTVMTTLPRTCSSPR